MELNETGFVLIAQSLFFYATESESMKSIKSVLLVVAAAVLLASCHGEGRPKDVLPPDRMVDFLAGAYQLESFYAVETQYRFDVLTESALRGYDSILAAQQLSRDQIERSLRYYSDHLDEYQIIQDSVVARLENLS